MSVKPAPTSVSIHELIAGRWSPRAYSSEPVSAEHLHAVLEAARWAPSAYNAQPWRFIVFDRSKDEVAFKRAFSTLVPFNQGWNAPAPVLIAVTAHTLTSKGEPSPTALYDAGAAAMSLVLQAHALGLAAHQMSGFDVKAFRAAFAIPPTSSRSRSSRSAITAMRTNSIRCCASANARCARAIRSVRSSTRTRGRSRSRRRIDVTQRAARTRGATVGPRAPGPPVGRSRAGRRLLAGGPGGLAICFERRCADRVCR